MAFFNQKNVKMKKMLLAFVVAGVLFSFSSCRETTEEKAEDAIEAAGEDIRRSTERAAEEIEEGAENLEREIEEERHQTDDVNPREN